MRNTLKFLLCTICCTMMFNNYGYSMHNNDHVSDYKQNIAPNDKIIAQELFYELRILLKIHNDCRVGSPNFAEFQRLTNHDITELAQEIIRQHPEVRQYVQDSWAQSSYENIMNVLVIAYDVIYNFGW